MRAEAQALKNNKRVKEAKSQNFEIDLSEAEEESKRLKASVSENREGKINILNKFLANRLGMSMQVTVDPPEMQKAEETTRTEEPVAVLQVNPEMQPFVPNAEEKPETGKNKGPASSAVAESKSPVLRDPFKIDHAAKVKTSPAGPSPPTQKAKTPQSSSAVKFQNPNFDDPQEEQMYLSFLERKDHIEEIIQREVMKKKSTSLPELLIEKVETTHNLCSKQNKFVKTSEACDLNLEHFQLVASKIRRTPLYQEEDFKELFELVMKAAQVFYKSKTDEELNKRRVVVKTPNDDNQKFRFRIPVLEELFQDMSRLDDELDQIEQNRKIDYARIKNDLKHELNETKKDNSVFHKDGALDGEIDRRQKEFITQNLGVFFENCTKLSSTTKRILQMTENIAFIEENNQINKKMIFEREYEAMRPLIEVNGIDLLKELLEAYPGPTEEEQTD